MFRNSFLALFLALFVSACGEVPTSPTEEKVLVELSAQPAGSNWYSWEFFLPPMCGSPALVNGFIDVHIVNRFVTYPDGSTHAWDRLNSARGRAWDVLGNEYVLKQMASTQQDYNTDGSYLSVSTFSFKVVPKGQEGPVQNLELTLRISFDPVVGFQFSSSAEINCRGN